MNITRKNMRIIPESNLGVYLWMLPNGKWLADEDNNLLSCDSVEGDIRVMAEMAAAARAVGFPDGKAVWQPAHKCTNEEYEEQLEELRNGKNPNVRIARRY